MHIMLEQSNSATGKVQAWANIRNKQQSTNKFLELIHNLDVSDRTWSDYYFHYVHFSKKLFLHFRKGSNQHLLYKKTKLTALKPPAVSKGHWPWATLTGNDLQDCSNLWEGNERHFCRRLISSGSYEKKCNP